MAVVAAPRISDSICDQIKQFAQSYAPGVAVGIIDGEGLRAFVGYGLDALNSKRQLSRRNQLGAPSLPSTFSARRTLLDRLWVEWKHTSAEPLY